MGQKVEYQKLIRLMNEGDTVAYQHLFEQMGQHDFKVAGNIVYLALRQIQAYMIESPVKLEPGELRVIVEAGKQVGSAAEALEQLITPLIEGGYINS